MIRAVPFRHLGLMVLGLAYATRPLACSLVLKRYTPSDDVPYANFDMHGISAGTGLVGAVLCAFPLLWLARRLAMPVADAPARPPPARTIAVAMAVAIAIALPGFAQIDYMRALPLAVMWPVVASALLWAVVVMAALALCLRSPAALLTMAEVRYRAIGIAVLVTAPKLMMLTL